MHARGAAGGGRPRPRRAALRLRRLQREHHRLVLPDGAPHLRARNRPPGRLRGGAQHPRRDKPQHLADARRLQLQLPLLRRTVAAMARRPHPQSREGRAGLQLLRPLGQAPLRPHPRHGEVPRRALCRHCQTAARLSLRRQPPRDLRKAPERNHRRLPQALRRRGEGRCRFRRAARHVGARNGLPPRRKGGAGRTPCQLRPFHQGLHRGPLRTHRPPAHRQEDSRTFGRRTRGVHRAVPALRRGAPQGAPADRNIHLPSGIGGAAGIHRHGAGNHADTPARQQHNAHRRHRRAPLAHHRRGRHALRLRAAGHAARKYNDRRVPGHVAHAVAQPQAIGGQRHRRLRQSHHRRREAGHLPLPQQRQRPVGPCGAERRLPRQERAARHGARGEHQLPLGARDSALQQYPVQPAEPLVRHSLLFQCGAARGQGRYAGLCEAHPPARQIRPHRSARAHGAGHPPPARRRLRMAAHPHPRP